MATPMNRTKSNEGANEHPGRKYDSENRPDKPGIDPQDPRSRHDKPGPDSPRRPEDLPEQKVSGRPVVAHVNQGEHRRESGVQDPTNPNGSNQAQEGHRDQGGEGQPAHSGRQQKKAAQGRRHQQNQQEGGKR